MAERYSIKVSSPELGKQRIISGTNREAVREKAQILLDTWNVEEQVQDRNNEAKARLEKIRNILRLALKSKPVIDLKLNIAEYPLPKPAYPDHVVYPPKPQVRGEPKPPDYLKYPPEPPAHPQHEIGRAHV